MQQQFENPSAKSPEKVLDTSAEGVFNFLDGLPEEIPGSQKTYHKTEIQTLVSEVLYGSKSLDRVTNAFGIHDAVRQHMRAQVTAAERQFPDFAQAEFHPMTGKPLATFEDRFHLADYLLRSQRLTGQSQELAFNGLGDVSPAICAKFYNDVFTAERGMATKSGNQTHRHFENGITMTNSKNDKNDKEQRLLAYDYEGIDSFRQQMEEAQKRGDAQAMIETQREADEFLQKDGVAARLASEYKLHVSVPADVLPLFLDRLMQVMKTDPFIKKNIIAFKVNTVINQHDTDGSLIPDIVLYPRRGVAPDVARANALVFSERLKVHLADLESPQTDVGIPRYNYKASPSLAIAQSGGDIKNSLKTLGLLDKYFDGTINHALFRPEVTVRS